MQPDIIAITGDLVDGSTKDLGPEVEGLRELQARYGVFFVTGNHEYYSGVDDWLSFLPTLGIRVLRNERVEVEHQGATLDIAGVDDWTAHHFGPKHGADLDSALQGRNTNRPLILLAHQPRQFADAARRGVDLQLSGHTHGGQIFPFNFIVDAVEPHLLGLHQKENSMLYVSKGTGYWGPPMRLFIPAEITEIELCSQSGTEFR